MEPSNGVKTWQWVVTAIVIIALIIIGIMVFGNKSSEEPTPTDTDVVVTDTTGAVNRIIMTDQYPGNVVNISSVQLAKTGWVVVQKDSAGKPGAVMGSKLVEAGVSPVRITLTQPMIDGSLYYVTLFVDNGDGKFDIATDTAVVDANGSAVMKPFRASTSATIEIKG